ncbi:MAG: ubiquinol oxidase subunit II [Candidatus Levybacteria bacterium]|nr:ubiquinol oxidase subunit II [Candidatus Levybacteria bacterium]
MNIKIKIGLALLFFVELFYFGLIFLSDLNFQLLNPQGSIARQQRDLGMLVIGILLVVAIPLIGAMYWFAYKYRAGNKKAIYKPDTRHSKFTELVWWLIPAVFIFILAIITWNKTHALDPYKPLESSVPPVRIQAIALNWKWLFLYPDYNIATVNFIQFPQDTPVNFEITADAPMNSFWIPALSGQIYAMSGMSTKLHLIADNTGDYRGQAGEINGRGFSGMKFIARASSREEFENWVGEVRRSLKTLDENEYSTLSKPSENNSVTHYSSYEQNLYNKIMMKYVVPDGEKKMEEM